MSEWHGYAKVLSAKEKKKENENCRCLDETQNLCTKTGRVFFSGNKRLNCRDKRVVGWRRYWLSQESSYEGCDLFPFFFFFFHFHLSLPPSPNLEYFFEKFKTRRKM